MRWTTAGLVSVLLVLSTFAVSTNESNHFDDASDVDWVVDSNETGELAFGWATSAGGAGNDFISQSTTYENGTFLVAGSFQGDLQFRDQIDGHGAYGGSSDRDAFIGWINPNGTWNTSISFGSTGIDSVEAVALLPNGDVIVAGNYCLNSAGFQCEMTLGTLDSLDKNDGSDDGNVFLARLNSDGTWAWSTQIGNAYDNFVFDMLVTPNNEIHLGVLYRDTFEFNGNILPPTADTTLMIAMFNEGGEPLSHVSLETQDGIEPVGSLCQDSAGQTYLASTFRGDLLVGEILLVSQGETDVMVASYQANEWSWAIAGGGLLEDRAWGCSGSTNQGLSVVGEYVNNATFGAFNTHTSQATDVLLGVVSSSGAWSEIVTASGVGVDRATNIITSPTGDIIIAGTTTAGLTIGSDALEDLDGVNDGMHNDIFLATYLTNGTWAWAVSAGGDGNDEPTDLTFASDGSPVLTFMLSGTAAIGIHSATSYGGYDVGVWLYQTDRDLDGILDGMDNCPRITNTAQGNHDGDLYGDDCDSDDDNDGLVDELDDCPTGEMGWTSDGSTDHDNDGCQDSGEDFDDDEDTVFDFADLCPFGPVGWVSTPAEDSEGDGCADYDTDEDGFIDQMDNCPSDSNPTQSDLDGDGEGDACDVDVDGDGVAAPDDRCPRDAPPWTSTPSNDYDQDGCNDATNDDDDDNDGYRDGIDACPKGDINWASEDTASNLDHDQDGCRDSSEDQDDDDDGYQDAFDACPVGLIGTPMPGQDMDMDGCVDGVEDEDDDNDGVLNTIDQCPQTSMGAQVGVQGCSMSQLDDDLDGVSNADDMCLNSLPGRLVDESGCAVLNEANGAEAEDDKSSAAGWLFAIAGILLLAAGAVTFAGGPGRKTGETPPKRPASLDFEPMASGAEHEAE
jgi:hypothetical protein